ncbi:uroporphyrinogen-III C-methyltransferase [Sinomicrobium sp. M5D2P17]
MIKNTNNNSPFVSLVGAGPGDPELLTLKAVKALETADVILYDALINKEILKHASTTVKTIFVGKRRSLHAYSQDEINQLLVDEARNNGHVVRLKGGDPFIFGRGGEEAAYLSEHDIPFQVIPGISSSVAVPANIGIPVTHRGVSESFWVVTATTSSGKLCDDIKMAAKSNATVVILMGMNKLAEITELFKAEKKEYMPVAVIRNGTNNNQEHCIGTVENILNKTGKKASTAPGIIVIGEVVKMHRLLSQNGSSPGAWNTDDEFIYQNLGLDAVPA